MRLAFTFAIMAAAVMVAMAAPPFSLSPDLAEKMFHNDDRLVSVDVDSKACSSYKHAKPIHCRPTASSADQEQVGQLSPPAEVTGWAARLDFEAEARAFDEQIAHEHQMAIAAAQASRHVLPFADSTNPLLSMGSFWLTSAWDWMSHLLNAEDRTSAEPPLTTKWKDTIPRFVSYGDSYIDSNSFGIPDPKKLKGFTYYNIAFWVSKSGASDNVEEWVKASPTQQKAIVKAYNDQGIRLGVALFGADDRPQSYGNDPWDLGRRIASFVKKNNLQGVDVDYEEYDKFEKRQATKWIIPLTRALREQLPNDQYYISHAPIAPLFNNNDYPLGYAWVEQRIGSLIDFYNVQFYNQGDYLTCYSTVKEGKNDNTALLQINSDYGIPLQKIVLGKPAQRDDADDGFLTAGGLGNCLAKYALPAGWKAGCMWWEYRGDLQSIINPVKSALGFE